MKPVFVIDTFEFLSIVIALAVVLLSIIFIGIFSVIEKINDKIQEKRKKQMDNAYKEIQSTFRSSDTSYLERRDDDG